MCKAALCCNFLWEAGNDWANVWSIKAVGEYDGNNRTATFDGKFNDLATGAPMPLNAEQKAFCDAFLGPAGAGVMQGQSLLLKQFAALSVPDSATKQEADDIAARIKSGRSLLDDSTTDRELAQAKVDLDAARELIDAVNARIASDRDFVPDDAALAARAEQADAVVDKAQARFDKAAGDILRVGDGLVTGFDPDANGDEVRDRDAAIAALHDALAPPVDATALGKAKAALLPLQKLSAAVKKRCDEARQVRTVAAVPLRAAGDTATVPDDATDAEKQALTTLIDGLKALDETPSEAALAQATKDAATLKDMTEKLTADLVARHERFDKAQTLFARLAADAKALQLHAQAPKSEAAQIGQDADKLKASAGKFDDWAAVTTWAASDLEPLESSIIDLEAQVKTLNDAVEKIIAELQAAIKLTSDAISGPGGRAFSDPQKAAFEGMLKAETDKTDADLAQAGPVITALAALAPKIQALSAALAAGEKRISAVKIPALDLLSTKEKADLTNAGDAAKAALDQVDVL